MEDYKVNVIFKDALPALSEQEVDSLRLSLKENGYVGPPIVLYGNTILDGHYRYMLCTELGIECPVQRIDFSSGTQALVWRVSSQLAQRNLNKAQKIQLAIKYKEDFELAAKERQRQAGRDFGRGSSDKRSDKKDEEDVDQNEKGDTCRRRNESDESAPKEKLTPNLAGANARGEVNEQLARIAGVGKETFRKCQKVLDKGTPDLIEAMLTGEKSIHGAYTELMSSVDTCSNEKVVPFPGQDEVTEKKYLESVVASSIEDVEKMRSLLEYKFTDEGGEILTEMIHEDLNRYFDVAMPILQKLSGIHLGNEDTIMLAENHSDTTSSTACR